MKNSISAIIPCYNAEPFLAEAIESVLKQTRPVSEILVVDDGSTDRSVQIGRSCGAKVIELGLNCGNSVARNAAVKAARGDLIAFLDADDSWNPNHCEVLCGLLEHHPGAAVAYSGMRLFGTMSGVLYQSPCDYQPFDAFWESFRSCLATMHAVMWRSVYLQIGGFDPQIRIASDYEFWLRVSASKHRFVTTPEATSNYRWHERQISSAPGKQLRSVYETRYRFLEAARQRGEVEFSIRLAQKMVAIWEEDIRNTRRDPELLRVLLALRPLVPGRPRVAAWIWLRSWLPPWIVKRVDRVRARLRLRARLAQGAAQLLNLLTREGNGA
jgi:glycosyltransferase involved in cell wall biosynthesis